MIPSGACKTVIDAGEGAQSSGIVSVTIIPSLLFQLVKRLPVQRFRHPTAGSLQDVILTVTAQTHNKSALDSCDQR